MTRKIFVLLTCILNDIFGDVAGLRPSDSVEVLNNALFQHFAEDNNSRSEENSITHNTVEGNTSHPVTTEIGVGVKVEVGFSGPVTHTSADSGLVSQPVDSSSVKQNSVYARGLDKYGSDLLFLQEAGFRILGAGAFWAWKRMPPPYSFKNFQDEVNIFVDLWILMGLTPDCRETLEALKSLVNGAAAVLVSPSDGVPRLPSITTDEGIKQFAEKLHFHPEHPHGIFSLKHGAIDEDQKAKQCTDLEPTQQKRFCAPIGDLEGWTFWFKEWLPTLADAFSCGAKADDSDAQATWEWMGGGARPKSRFGDLGEGYVTKPEWTWNTSRFIRNPGKASERDIDVVRKCWRLVHRYLTDDDYFSFESANRYSQKEQARFVPFLGIYLDPRPLASLEQCTGNDIKPGDEIPFPDCAKDDHELHQRLGEKCIDCNPVSYTLYNNNAIMRQTFYGPTAWGFFHTCAEIIAQRSASAPALANEMMKKFKELLPVFGAMHPCPHCHKHFLTKVQFADFNSYDGSKTLGEHRYRERRFNSSFQSSAEILLYPLEWIILARTGQDSKHVMGANLGSWDEVLGLKSPEDQSIHTRLDTVTKPEDLRIFLWKLHNAVDATLESKYEERTLPFPAGYWPVSRFYRGIEPFGHTDTAEQMNWADFRIKLVTECGLDENRAATEHKRGSSLFPVVLRADDMERLTSNRVDGVEAQGALTHLRLIQRTGVGWRQMSLIYLNVLKHLHGDSCAEPGLNLPQAMSAVRDSGGRDSSTFCRALSLRIHVEDGPEPLPGCPAMGTVKSRDIQQAVAFWMCAWPLWSMLLNSLEEQIECVSNFVVNSGLLQKKFGPTFKLG